MPLLHGHAGLQGPAAESGLMPEIVSGSRSDAAILAAIG
jgi:hypothetical protein